MKKELFCLLALSLSSLSLAATYDLPTDDSQTVGQLQSATTQSGDTLDRLAVRYGVGYNEILQANPEWKGRKIPTGTTVTIPTLHQLPVAAQQGIVINLADMRLYYYPPGSNQVVTYPVAVGKRGWQTPQGTTSVIAKRKNPTWTPPASIHREAAKSGKKLKKVYPAGPNNPLGTRALRLGLPGYLIHGTNQPQSIGKRISHGCIRLRREDIEALFSMVEVDTPVTIVSQPSHSATYQVAATELPQAPVVKQATKRSAAVAQAKPKQSTTASRARNNQVSAEVTTRTSPSYLQDGNFDYRRLQNDIDSGQVTPIDLSGI